MYINDSIENYEINYCHSSTYNVNEFALKNEPEFRVGIRWVYRGSLDYQLRNYDFLYVDIDTDIFFEIVEDIGRDLKDNFGDDWYDDLMFDLRNYFDESMVIPKDRDARNTTQEDGFYEALTSIIALAFFHPEKSKRESIASVIEKNKNEGHGGHHLECVWQSYNAPNYLAIRMLNSWENEEIDAFQDKTIFPVEYVSFTDRF